MSPLAAGDVVLCGGTVRAASFRGKVEAAAAAGFQGVSLYWSDYEHARGDGWSDAGLRALLDDHGLAMAELDGDMGWLVPGSGAPSVPRFLDAAAALGARSVTALEVTGRAPSTAGAAEIFAGLCDQAAEAGLLVHIEYFPWSGIADIGTAFEIVRLAGRPNGGIMVDVWHHIRGPDAGALDLGGVPGASILAVQVGDVLATPSPSVRHEAMHERLLPGEGAGNVAAILRALRDHGCTAPMEVEVYSDRLAALAPRDAAGLAGVALREVLARAGVI